MTISDIIDQSELLSEGAAKQLVNMDELIAEKQEEQNEFAGVLTQCYNLIDTQLLSSYDWVFRYGLHYTGSGIGVIDSNLTEWQSFNSITTNFTFGCSNSIGEFTSPCFITDEPLSSFNVGNTLYFRIPIPSDPIPYGTITEINEWFETDKVSDSILTIVPEEYKIELTTTSQDIIIGDILYLFTDASRIPEWGKVTDVIDCISGAGGTIWLDMSTSQGGSGGPISNDITYIGSLVISKTSISMNMIEGSLPSNTNMVMTLEYEHNGHDWDSNVDIVSNINSFNYALDSIHHPLGETGTYGTKEMIASMQLGRNITQSNKTKYDGARSNLEDFV